MSFLTITSSALAQVPNFLNATERQLERATLRAVRKVARSSATQASREIAAAHDLPVSLLRRRGQRWTRVHIKQERADGDAGPSALVWIGTNPIKAGYLGALRQRKDGARVRRHFFAGAFVSRMQNGHRGIFIRREKTRLPIDEQTVTLDRAAGIVRKLQGAIPSRLSSVFKQELNYELNVRGK